jgi:hypothetical protein
MNAALREVLFATRANARGERGGNVSRNHSEK